MSNGSLIILGLGALLGCWAMLTLIGGERARRLRQLQAQRPRQAPTPPAPAAVISHPESPVGVAQPVPPSKHKSAKPKPAAAKPPLT